MRRSNGSRYTRERLPSLTSSLHRSCLAAVAGPRRAFRTNVRCEAAPSPNRRRCTHDATCSLALFPSHSLASPSPALHCFCPRAPIAPAPPSLPPPPFAICHFPFPIHHSSFVVHQLSSTCTPTPPPASLPRLRAAHAALPRPVPLPLAPPQSPCSPATQMGPRSQEPGTL